MLLARVAHRHGKAAELGHRRQVLAELAGAYQQHAVLGAEDIDQQAVAQRQLPRSLCGAERHLPVGQAHRPPHHSALLQFLHEIVQRRRVGVEFQQQLEGPAAGRAEAVGLVGGHAVRDETRRAAADARPVLCDQIIFDAAAADGPHDAAVFGQCQDRAGRPR